MSAATTQREIDALADPVTIDLSEINRMDTVGAWIVYRTVRDRDAKVIGASRDEVSLRVVTDERRHLMAVLLQLREHVGGAEAVDQADGPGGPQASPPARAG